MLGTAHWRIDTPRKKASFRERESLAHRRKDDRLRYYQEPVYQVGELLEGEPNTSMRGVSAVLNLSRSTVHRILHSKIFLYP